jgi:site-specific DNA recombinase
VLRSYLFCEICDRRMFGKTRRNAPYNACQPSPGYRPRAHPISLGVREEHLLNGITQFFAERVLGPTAHPPVRGGLGRRRSRAA